MSQDEVLRCLVTLGGSAWHDDLANEYNKVHFPRNINYREVENVTVKKTMQGDLAKLLKYNFITRVYKKPEQRRATKRFHRQEGYYSITPLGFDYIKLYKIVEVCP